jgi:hypothetical protein
MFWGAQTVIRLTPGNVSNIRVADDLIEAAGPIRHLIADRGYDANRLRHTLGSDVDAISDPAQ